jgi:hypothetical protein
MDAEQKAAVLDLSTSPAPRPEDVRSPEALVRSLYECISGPAESEREREWDRLRSLALPDIRFVLVRWQGEVGEEEQVLRGWDLEGFIATAKYFYRESAFYERELWHRTERFGNIAHVLSTYESRLGPDDPEPIMRGINSIQAVRDDRRWWIASVVWDLERPENPIPTEYLPGRDPTCD